LTEQQGKRWLHPENMQLATERVLTPRQAELLATAFELLVAPTRLRMLHALACAEELCVFDLGLLLGLEQSTVSQQLRMLRDRGIVSRRKVGRLAFYRLEDPALRAFLGSFDGRAGEAGVPGGQPSPWVLAAPRAAARSDRAGSAD
jgi:DNA-binding transcriptional ArsR family regulator